MARLQIVDWNAPLYRIVRREWIADALNASFSRRMAARRWNTAQFPALYCCASHRVARAVVRDLFGMAAVTLEDLQPARRPDLAEIRWTGELVDLSSEAGLIAAGFPAAYPAGTTYEQTQAAAVRWHRSGREGVLARSASLHRAGQRAGETRWAGDPAEFCEVTLFVRHVTVSPSVVGIRPAEEWIPGR